MRLAGQRQDPCELLCRGRAAISVTSNVTCLDVNTSQHHQTAIFRSQHHQTAVFCSQHHTTIIKNHQFPINQTQKPSKTSIFFTYLHKNRKKHSKTHEIHSKNIHFHSYFHSKITQKPSISFSFHIKHGSFPPIQSSTGAQRVPIPQILPLFH